MNLTSRARVAAVRQAAALADEPADEGQHRRVGVEPVEGARDMRGLAALPAPVLAHLG
jgi:hypothetical protein